MPGGGCRFFRGCTGGSCSGELFLPQNDARLHPSFSQTFINNTRTPPLSRKYADTKHAVCLASWKRCGVGALKLSRVSGSLQLHPALRSTGSRSPYLARAMGCGASRGRARRVPSRASREASAPARVQRPSLPRSIRPRDRPYSGRSGPNALIIMKYVSHRPGLTRCSLTTPRRSPRASTALPKAPRRCVAPAPAFV